MISWDLLVEIELDSKTLRYSISGSSSKDGYYDGKIISVSDIAKDIIPGGGVSPIQSCYIEIDDTEGNLKKECALTTFVRRYVRVKLLNLDSGESYLIFGGRIISVPEFDYGSMRIEVRDDSYDSLEEPISLRTTPDIFPNLPADTPSLLIPIVLGTVDSNDFGKKGHIPAYLVDPKIGVTKYRYVAAQHPLKSIIRVCRNGIQLPASAYTISYANVSTPIGSIRMTFIDFNADPRDSENDDTLITYDATGLTSDNAESGSLVTNPATALVKFLGLRSKVLSSEFNSALLSQAEADYNSEDITIGLVVIEDDSWLDVVERICRSYNLCFFRTGSGYYATLFDKAATHANPSSLPIITDANDIIKGTFSMSGRGYFNVDRPVSTLEVSYARDYGRDLWCAIRNETYSPEVTALAKDVRELTEIEVRHANIAGKLVQAKIFQRSSSRNYVVFSTSPRSFELGDFFRLTHFSGVSSDGMGFVEDVFRIFGITVSGGDSSGVEYEIRAIDAAGLTITNPGVVEPGRQTVVPPSRIVSLMSDVVWTPTETKVTWAGPTGGSFSVKIVRPLTTDTYTVTSGSSPDLSVGVPLYVYFAPEISTTVLQTSTSIDDALGDRKYLMAIAQRATVAGGIALVDNKVGFVTVGSRVVPGGIGGDQLYDNISYTGTLVLRDGGGTEKAGMTASGTGDSNIRIWAGNTFANRASAPFRVTQSGILSATGATISGTITASSGTIGGWSIGSTSLSGGYATLSSTGYLSLGTGNNIARLDANDTTYRLWIGNATAASAPFRVTQSGILSATGATISGTITASSGTIGGWSIGSTSLSGGSVLLSSTGYLRVGSSNNIARLDANDTTYRLWIGNATAASAPFRVSKGGLATMVGATFKSADSGARIVIDSTGLYSYDSSNNLLVSIPTSGGGAGNINVVDTYTTHGKILIGTYSEIYGYNSGYDLYIVHNSDAIGTLFFGTDSVRWGSIIVTASSFIDLYSSNDIYIYTNSTNPGTLYLGDSLCFWKYIYLYANYSINAISKGDIYIRPYVSNGGYLYLGNSTYFWNYIYLYANYSINAISKGTVTIRPNTSGNGTLYLGSNSYKWDYIELNAYSSFGMGAKYSSSRYAGFNASSGGVDSTIFSYYNATYYAKILAHAESTFSSITFSSNRIGFFGASAAAKQTVSGSREGNAALASLLTALANYGLITNSTT